MSLAELWGAESTAKRERDGSLLEESSGLIAKGKEATGEGLAYSSHSTCPGGCLAGC